MRKLRKQAKELLHAANKVYHYRRDVIPAARLNDLEQTIGEVDQLHKNKQVDPKAFEAAQARLDALLRKLGGKIYPKTFWSDNIEVILVAAIIVIGIRSFFFQPFIIPTNSMYPTYSGMNAVVYEEGDSVSTPTKIFRLITLGARHKSLSAKESGALFLRLTKGPTGSVQLRERIRGPKWIILKAWYDRYTFVVNGAPHELIVPAEFDMAGVLTRVFGEIDPSNLKPDPNDPQSALLDLNTSVDKGDSIVTFDITLGDALFVDRISYHFTKPDVGDPFVFRTDPIIDAVGRATGDYTPKYYIKRIAGKEGETLEIIDNALFANGAQRTEVDAFVRNAELDGDYSGYNNERILGGRLNQLGEGRTLTIPADSYVALGDNSNNSADSRYWGFVPDEAVIGKAVFIYYPFTKRWGLAE